MKGHPKVLTELQKLLSCELAARDQYFIHSRMYEDWGLDRLYHRISHEMEEETEHADALIRRILFLEGIPDLSKVDDLHVGGDVPAMLKNDLKVEYQVDAMLKQAIAVCEQAQDYQTREILEVLLRDTEEDHAYWLEQQLWLIDQIGLPNYLQSQMHGEAPSD